MNPRLETLLNLLEQLAGATSLLREGQISRFDAERKSLLWSSDTTRVQSALNQATEECRLQIMRVVGRRERESRR